MSQIRSEVLASNRTYAANFGDKSKLALPPARGFATLKAVRYVYDLLEQNSCNHCGQNEVAGTDRQPLYYLV